MQGRGRGQLLFYRAQPVTAPSTVATVTYDDPNGSWENWEPGANWNGNGAGGGGRSDAPNPQPTPNAQAAKPEGLRWDEDSDTNLRHPGSKQLPGTLITMSELDWEDTEELATELWRHPMRPRISREQHARGDAQRLPARSPVRPDPRQLPMPLPGPGGARPHARSEEPTARLRMAGANGLTQTSVQPRVAPGAHAAQTGAPQRLPAAPAPRPEPERRARTTTQPGAHAVNASTQHEFEDEDSSTAMPADWLDEAPTPYALAEYASPPSAAYAPPPSAAGHQARPGALVPPPPAGPSSYPPPRDLGATATGYAPRRGSLIHTQAAGFAPASRLPPAPAPRPGLPVEPMFAAPSQLPPAPAPRPSLPVEPMFAAPTQLPPAPAPRPGLPVEPMYGADFGPPARLPPAPAARPSVPAETMFADYAAPSQLPPAPAPRPSLPAEPMYGGDFGAPARLPPAPAARPSLPAEPMFADYAAPSQLPPAPAPRPSLSAEPMFAGYAAPSQLPPAPPAPAPRPSLPAETLLAFAPPSQLPPAPAARPSLPAEPVTRTQSFDAPPPSASRIESLRERSLTPPRLLPPPPRFQSSAHIPTIIGTPAATPVPPSRRLDSPHSLTQSGARVQPRAAGRDVIMGPPPREHAQSQLIEQLQEQLLEAMARARVQEARAAEAEKSVEQAEEQLAGFARGNSEEAEQLQLQVMQLSEQLQATEARAFEAERRAHQPDNMLHLVEPELTPRGNKQGRANLILSGLLASSLSFGGAAYFMFYAPLQKQLVATEQLRTQDSQAHATAVSNLQARSNAEKQGLEAQNADLRKQLDAAKAEATAAASPPDEGKHGRRHAAADSTDGTPAGTRSARAIERRMRRSHAAQGDDGDEAPKSRKSRGGDNDPLGGI